MSFWARCGHFLGSRSGHAFVLFLSLSLIVSASVGYGFYASNLSWFKQNKSEEKITALRLVDAFVNEYAALRAQLSTTAPVPASFRADAIAAFNQANGGNSEFNLIMVGVPGREIKTKPTDGAMAAAVESFTREKTPKPVSEFLAVGGHQVFRTVYPSLAGNESCVDCHNQIQAGQPIWHLNDVMGAFAIDVPMGPFLRTNLLESNGLGAATFAILAALGLAFAIFQHRKSEERDRAAATLAVSEARFRDFAESASDWFWEQDENLRFSRFSHGGTLNDIAGSGDLGKTRRETVKLGVSDEQWASHDADLAARRPFHNFRFQRELADGRTIHVSVSGTPVFDATGKFLGYRGAGRDITAEVAVEVELARRVEERTAELSAAQSELVRKERLSALGQLTATMAHELRNPLSAIRNTLFSVKETAKTSGLDLDRSLGRVERSVTRCDRIITDLLDFTRMKELHPTVLAADPWIEEVLNDQHVPSDITLARISTPGASSPSTPSRCAAWLSTSWTTLPKPCPRAAANGASRSAARSSTTGSSSRYRTPAPGFRPISCPRCSSRCSAPRASAPAWACRP